MKLYLFLSLIVLTIGAVSVRHSAAGCADEYTDAEIEAALQAAPWESMTHSHDSFGEHTHAQWFRQVELPPGCLHMEYSGHDHPDVEPEPEPEEIPVVEGYTPPIVLTCIAGPCLEKESPNQVIGPLDIHGNLPPEPAPGDPEIFYPTVEIDGQIYWDSTQEPYQISEAAENAETTPDGYRLEDIQGQLFLVPSEDTSAHTPVETSEDPAQQDTFIIYTVVEQIGGTNYLQPTPFHAHPVDDSADDSVDDLTNTGVDPQVNQESQDPQGTEGPQSEESETFASLDGKFYQVTSNPPIPLQVTEYMVRTWGNGQDKLPQWIEIYNPNALAVNLVGYEFSYAYKKQTHAIQLRHFLIPPEGTIILATHIPDQRYRYDGITEQQVYNLGIENALKHGWLLKDPLGGIISQTGKVFGEKEAPIMPERLGISRVSYNVYSSERTKVSYYFGFRKDVSTPGFHEPQIPRSPALLRQRMKTTWAAFKKK